MTKEIKCEICDKRVAVINYCNSVLEWSHGLTIMICRPCYIKELLKAKKIIGAAIREERAK